MLNSHDLADRQILAAIREHKTLSLKRYKTTKLESPVQRGWRRFYVLAEHASNRRDRPILEAILRVIGPVVVHHSRDFRRRRGRPRKLLEIQQPLRAIPLHEWERKNYPHEWFNYFRHELIREWNHHWQPYWVFKQPSLYQLKVGRNWLWYFREVDPAIETRLSELDRWLKGRGRQQRYDWLKGRRQRYRWREEDTARQQSLRREQLGEITRAYATFPEVDPAAPTWRSRISLRSGPRMRSKYTGMDCALCALVTKLYLVMPLLTKLHFVHNRKHWALSNRTSLNVSGDSRSQAQLQYGRSATSSPSASPSRTWERARGTRERTSDQRGDCNNNIAEFPLSQTNQPTP